MAPYDVTSWGSSAEPLVHLFIGGAFGFVLERAGFGDAKKLAAQFYLDDMSVLKVMFTAIVTAMLLVFLSVAVGVLDYERLWVNPTYLASGIVGGLIFGVGFVLGGYCPGTCIVAAATLKLDGLAFLVGTLVGVFGFAYTVPAIEQFWYHSGFLGRFTLYDWLQVSPPVVVGAVVVMAIGMFTGAEALERWVRSRSKPSRSQEAGAMQDSVHPVAGDVTCYHDR